MKPLAPLLRALLVAASFGTIAEAQQPQVYLKFDGDLADSSPSGIITTVTPNGPAPTYAPDRNGQADKAIVFAGSGSLQLVAAAFPNNSNRALGLRNDAGTNTPFTIAAWVYFNAVSGQSYNTVFGNAGTGAGILHAGLGGTNTSKTHFSFNSAELNGLVGDIAAGQWFHLAFVNDPSNNTERIYINGIPEATRFGAPPALQATDLLLGNWGTTTHATNDLRGRLDDVVVFNTVLNGGQIHGLFAGVDANNLSPTYSGPRIPGVAGSAGTWGVREIKNYPGISLLATGSTLLNADRIARRYAVTPQGTVKSYQASVINHSDPDAPGISGNFANELFFETNTTAADDNFILLAHCGVRIPEEADYTFGFRGNDGARLRVIGKQFISSSRLAGANPANPAHFGDGLYYTNATQDSHTLGVVHLTPGDYNLEFLWWEGDGPASVEVFAAIGAKTAFDSTFQLIGNTAAGGLEIVQDPDFVPILTMNGALSLFVHSGSPTEFTLAWSVPNPGTTLSIDQGIGAVPQSGSQVIPTPSQTTTYTITATTGSLVVTRTATVYIDSPPVLTLSANDTTVTANAPVTLKWTAQGATSLTLQPGNIDVTGQTSRVVNPADDTTYTLVGTNAAGASQVVVTIDVGLPPAINIFAFADPNPIYGEETSLSWNLGNWNPAIGDTASINQGVGALANSTGTIYLRPLQTATYTLTAANTYGSSSATATVNQSTPIGVAAPGFSVRRVNAMAGTPLPFAGQGYLQSAISLLGGQNAAATQPAVATSATVNFTNGADGEFTSGNSQFPGGGGTNFAVQITATLVVNAPGEYTFVVSSDDGARLRIDGQDVIVDDGSHSPASNSGRVTLTKPTAQLELIHYEATDPTGQSNGGEIELAWIRPNLTWQLLTTIVPAAPIVRGQVLISEFMAENKNTLLDEDNEASDWIEIWNSTTTATDLLGYYLTDDPAVLNKWAFPTRQLAGNEYLVVFASGKNRQIAANNLHTNFKLSTTGEYLALTRDNGAGGFEVVSSFAPTYPPQKEDLSYGSADTEGYIGYMETPTPGGPNGATTAGFVEKLVFSHLRGRYSAPFDLSITTPTPGTEIRYTTDGRLPTSNIGTIYTGPIPIAATTVVRAAAFKPGWRSTDVETQSYLFVSDIITQTAATARSLGFPATSVNGQVFRYGMNQAAVVGVADKAAALKSALEAAPTVCLTTEIGNLVNPTTGFYVNPGRHGLFWERPVSMEYINAAGGSEFQIDCGARTRGGFSRDPNNPKHAFHIYFRDSLYDGDLKYRLFGAEGASEFSQIDLRCEQNYSWSYQNDGQNSLMREEWSRITQGAMGQPYARTSYFHLYLNGIYWGVYNFEERTEAAYGETYLGGQKEDYDVVKSAGSSGGYNTEMTDGNFAAWRKLNTLAIALKNDATEAGRTVKLMELQGRNPDGSPNPAFPVLLDLDNLIDYNLLVFYDGSFDSPLSTFLSNGSNNWFGMRNRLGSRGFVYFAHDHEHGMNTGTNSYNRVGPWGGTGSNNWNQGQYGTREQFARSNPQYIHELLAYSAEYRSRFADRAQRHLFNGGALSKEKAIALVNSLATQVDAIIHAEAARWGSAGLNRNSWLGAKNSILSFINTGGNSPGAVNPPLPVGQPRNVLLAAQLARYKDVTDKPLFPSLVAPTVSGPYGGPVASPHTLTLTNPNVVGTLYYTVNGPDPRAVGGGIAPEAITGSSPISVTLNSTSTLRARVYDSTNANANQQWSPLIDPEYLVGALAAPSNLVISKIHYNPEGPGDLTEFVEVMNISAATIDLTNVRFMLGIDFQFPDGLTLAAGARALILRDAAAFAAAYPNIPSAQIVGVFANSNNLDNDGERLQLLDAAGAVIRDFSYDKDAPWPNGPNGGGPALVLKRPETNPDHSDPANWRASSDPGGNPGVSDALSYAAWAAANGVTDLVGGADDDEDGLSNLEEYFFRSNPKISSIGAQPFADTQSISVNGSVAEYLTITFSRGVSGDDLTSTVEASRDLTTWIPAVLAGRSTYNLDGTESVTYRYPEPRNADAQQFLRVRVTR